MIPDLHHPNDDTGKFVIWGDLSDSWKSLSYRILQNIYKFN